jgi:glycerol 3-phosphatase-2
MRSMHSSRQMCYERAMNAELVKAPERVTIDDLAERYRVFLLDAYGVLVDGSGALANGRRILTNIRAHGCSLLILTNDASRLPETAAARFQRLGLDIEAQHVITSGSLLAPHFQAHGLRGARCMVLGSEDSATYVKRAGGEVVPIAPDSDIDALIICDGQGYPFLHGIEAGLSAVVRKVREDGRVSLILTNPDVIFPKAPGTYGFTSGAVALLIEAGLARLFPDRPGPELCFTRLGKPHAPMFQRARELAGTDSLIMVGDQLETDIAGAHTVGLPSALVESGLGRWLPDEPIQPDYLLTLPEV